MNVEKYIHDVQTLLQIEKKNIKNIGLFSGVSGVLMFESEYSNFFNLNNDFSEETIEIANSLINKSKILPTYCSGLAGFLWTLVYIKKNFDIKFYKNDDVIFLDKILFDSMKIDLIAKRYDFLHESLGYLYYFYHNLENNSNCIEYINFYLDDLIKNNNSFKESDTYSDLGIAHGLPSMLLILSIIYKDELFEQYKNQLLDIINSSLKFIMSTEFKYSSQFIFPHKISSNEHNRIAWCYGDLSTCFALFSISLNIDDDNLKDYVLNLIHKHVIKRISSKETLLTDNYLCHGRMGVYVIYKRLYDKTNLIEFKLASEFWFEKSIEKLKINTDQPLNLLNGLSGIGLGLISHLNPNTKWQDCLLLN